MFRGTWTETCRDSDQTNAGLMTMSDYCKNINVSKLVTYTFCFFYIWAPEELSARPCSGAMEHALFYRLKSKRLVNKRWIALCVCLCASVRVSRIGLSFSLSKRYTHPHLGSPEPLLSTPAHHWILIIIHYEVTHLTALCLISLLRTHH